MARQPLDALLILLHLKQLSNGALKGRRLSQVISMLLNVIISCWLVAGSKYSIENIVDELHFESVLTILDATEDDFGHYLCSVENANGSASKDVLVSIYFEAKSVHKMCRDNLIFIFKVSSMISFSSKYFLELPDSSHVFYLSLP